MDQELECEYKYKRMETIHKHNLRLLMENRELKQSLNELLPMANHWYEYLKTFESWAKDDNPPPDWFAKLPEYEATIKNAEKLLNP